MKTIITIFLTALVVGGGSYYYFTNYKKSSGQDYQVNNLDVATFRDESLYPTESNIQRGRFESLGNNWLKFTNKEAKYTVEVPDTIFDSTWAEEPVPSVIIQPDPNISYLIGSYHSIESKALLGVGIPKGEDRIKMLSDVDYAEGGRLVGNAGGIGISSSRLLYTAETKSDQDLIKAAKYFYGNACNFTSVTKTESKQKGIFDVKLGITNPNSESCSYISKLTQDLIDHDYVPDVIKYSPTAKKALFVASSQGCRWTLPGGNECADDRILESFVFTD